METNAGWSTTLAEWEQMRLIVVGLGHQSTEDHIPAVMSSGLFTLVGVVDRDAGRAASLGEQLAVVSAESVSAIIDKLEKPPEVAIVAVPHSEYLPIIRILADNGINVIKEKPFAVSIAEARTVEDCVRRTNITLCVTLQRRFNPIYLSFAQLIRHVGRIHAIEARYTLNIERLDEGWRASQLHAGGGALVDLGYHYIDLILWYFGLPDFVTCRHTGNNRPGQVYDTEDTVFLQFGYLGGSGAPDVLGSLIVSRVYPDREESLTVFGTNGSASVSRGRCQRRGSDGALLESLSREGAWPSALVDQLEQFAVTIRDGSRRGQILPAYLEQVAFVDASYRSAQLGRPVDPRETAAAWGGVSDGNTRDLRG
jgi:predicted dehydrogenase